MLDVACGHGAVTGIAVAAARSAGIELEAHCADYSQAAVDELCKRFPGVEGVACDAADMPWPDQRFDFVVSQFGIEYAGDAAFGEAARLVAEGGTLAALTHLQGGAIHAECADNYAVAAALRESRLMTLARGAFEAGFNLMAGKYLGRGIPGSGQTAGAGGRDRRKAYCGTRDRKLQADCSRTCTGTSATCTRACRTTCRTKCSRGSTA